MLTADANIVFILLVLLQVINQQRNLGSHLMLRALASQLTPLLLLQMVAIRFPGNPLLFQDPASPLYSLSLIPLVLLHTKDVDH